MIQPLTVGIAIFTLNSAHHLLNCITPLRNSPLKPKILIVDSSSTDGTVETAARLGVETHVIPKEEFNHGTTREKARRLLNTDIVVMLTPDAYAIDPDVLGILIKPIIEKKASVAYARQIPHEGADFLEAFPRHFNYPAQSHIRGIENLEEHGVYTFFCSDSCAAYSNKALDEIGSFQPVLLGEDTVAAAQLLRKGHKIAYVAEAIVRHSHRYTLWQEFCRYFDTGLARQEYRDIFEGAGSDGKRGRAYVAEMLKFLIKQKPFLIPYAIMHCAVKWLGYKIGKSSLSAPTYFKKALSSQKSYWNSLEFKKKLMNS